MSDDALALIAAGNVSGFDRVLQHCRFEGFGMHAFGREAIRDGFLRYWSPQPPDGIIVAGGGDVAGWFGECHALVAETVDGWVVRLWALGERASDAGLPPSLSVPFDPDLDQRPDRVDLDAAAFPHLPSDDLAWLEQVMKRVRVDALGERLPLARHRAVPLLAWSEGGAAAALFRVQGQAEFGLAGFQLAMVRAATGEERIVIDQAGVVAARRQRWNPMLRP